MSTSAVAIVLFLTSLHVASSKIMLPTISNSTGDYFISSASSFEGGSISCTQANCQIICNTYHGCFDVNILTPSTSTLFLQCSVPWACGLIKLNSNTPPTDALWIVCEDRNPCWNSDFITDTKNVSLSCHSDDACSVINLKAGGDLANVSCMGSNACSHFNLNLYYVTSIYVTARGASAFANATVDARGAGSFRLTCSAE
eukprot:483284_1